MSTQTPSLLPSFHPQTHEQVEKDPDLAELVEEDIGGEAHYGTKPDHSAAAEENEGTTKIINGEEQGEGSLLQFANEEMPIIQEDRFGLTRKWKNEVKGR